MDIVVTFMNGRWVTDPNPAIVSVGTDVRWIFRAPRQENRTLLWKVEFTARLPFGEEHATLETMTRFSDRSGLATPDIEHLRRLGLDEDAELNHRGATKSQPASQPGEFKYDLIVQDAITGERIGDDDPWLIVVRGVIRPFDFYVF
jgi:hypothetical protein